MYNETEGLVNIAVMLMKNYTLKILLIALFSTSSGVLACSFTPEVEFLGNGDTKELFLSTSPGDEFNIKCNGTIKSSGIVNIDSTLKMTNSAEFNVKNMNRNMVIQKLKQIHAMLNSPNPSLSISG